MESVAELEAFVNVCRKYTHRFPMQEGIDFAGPYDGRKSSFIATFATAFVLASCGIPVTMHGSAPLPPKWGYATAFTAGNGGYVREHDTRNRHSCREAGWCTIHSLRTVVRAPARSAVHSRRAGASHGAEYCRETG